MPEQSPIPTEPRGLRRLHVPDWSALEPLAEEFFEMRDYSEASAYQARYVVRRFAKWLEDSGATNPLQYRQYLVGRGVSRAYISGQFSILRNFFEYLVLRQVVPHNPFRAITVRAPKPQRLEGLTRAEIGRLTKVLPDSKPRPKALINLLLRTAIRVQAARLANVEDVDTSTEVPRLWVQHKGHRERDLFVLLYPGAMRPLTEWLHERPETRDPALFVAYGDPHNRLSYHSLYKDVKGVFLEAEIHRPPHALRHTAITLAREGGASLDGVREMAGHTDPKVTLAYDHSIQRWQNPAEKVLDDILGNGGNDAGRNEA